MTLRTRSTDSEVEIILNPKDSLDSLLAVGRILSIAIYREDPIDPTSYDDIPHTAKMLKQFHEEGTLTDVLLYFLEGTERQLWEKHGGREWELVNEGASQSVFDARRITPENRAVLLSALLGIF